MDKLKDCHSRARIVGVGWIGAVSVTTWYSFIQHTNDNWWIIIISCGICFAINVLTFIMFAIDKCLAKMNSGYDPQCSCR